MSKQPKWKTRIQATVRAENVADLDQAARAAWLALEALRPVPMLVAK